VNLAPFCGYPYRAA